MQPSVGAEALSPSTTGASQRRVRCSFPHLSNDLGTVHDPAILVL